jgi:hypothetical protein
LIFLGKKYNPQKVWTIVALTWRDRENTSDGYKTTDHHYNKNSDRTYIHHLDNNGYNNDYKNLLWVTPSEHKMIHIKGIYFQMDYQLKFYGNNFLLLEKDKEIIRGKFCFNIQSILENGNFIDKGDMMFISDKESIFYFEQKELGSFILRENQGKIIYIKELCGKWERLWE